MRITISVDDKLLEETDEAAREIGLSRSRLLSLAVEDYLRHRRRQQMTEQLNEVHRGGPVLAERRTLTKMKTKFRSSVRQRW